MDSHGLGGNAMAVGKQLLELAMNEPTTQKFADRAERQFVLNAIFKNASAGTIWREKVGVLPAMKGAGNLDIAELTAFDVIAMLKNPTDPEWSQRYT